LYESICGCEKNVAVKKLPFTREFVSQ